MVKRVLSLIIAMVMILGMAGAAFAEGETAPAETEPVATEAPEASQEWLDYLKEKNYVTGYEDGTMGLEKNITRAEMATILVRAKDKQSAADGLKGVPSRFSDMYVGHWANGYVNLAVGDNIIKGYTNGKFMPARNISNAEAVTMIVRATGVLTKAEDDLLNANYPYSYINKAKEIGLLKGVNIANFQEMATRENVFKMVYNYLMDEEYGEHTVVKGIFIENDRTESLLKADEMVLEIMTLEQRANYVKESREYQEKYSRGTQLKLTIPVGKKPHWEVEHLLGKVAYVTLDNRLKDKPEQVVQIKIDETYDYVFGAAGQVDRPGSLYRFEVGDKEYTVDLGEGFEKRDDRIFRTYRNDKPMEYKEFNAKDRLGALIYPVDFAKATVKNGKLVFIDSFAFEDIAPVESIRESDKAIRVWSDKVDGQIETLNPRDHVIAFDGSKDIKFTRVEKGDIVPNDVIHAYGTGGIVRKDALVQGEFDFVERTGSYYAVLKGDLGKFRIHTALMRRPVYSTGGPANTDGSAFRTLIDSESPSVLKPFQGKETTVLRDIFGHLQLIKSGFEYTDNTAIVYELLSKGDAKFLRRDNKFANLSESWRTQILDASDLLNNTTAATPSRMTIKSALSELNRADLVYVLGEQGQDINVILRLATWPQMSTLYNDNTAHNGYGYFYKGGGQIVVAMNAAGPAGSTAYKHDVNTEEFQRNAVVNRALAWNDGTLQQMNVNTTTYTVLPRTNIFNIDADRRYIRSGALPGSLSESDLGKNILGDTGQKVVVFSDFEVNNVLRTALGIEKALGGIGSEYRGTHYYTSFSNRKDIAHTIVFVNDARASVGNADFVVRLTKGVSYNPTTVEGKLSDNRNGAVDFKRVIDLDRFMYNQVNHIRNANANDVYEFWAIKSEEGNPIVRENLLIGRNDPTFRVVLLDGRSFDSWAGYGYRVITLEDGNGDLYEIYLDNDFELFGRLTPQSIVQVDKDAQDLLVPDSVGAHRVTPKRIPNNPFANGGSIRAISVRGTGSPTANIDRTFGAFDVLRINPFYSGNMGYFGYMGDKFGQYDPIMVRLGGMPYVDFVAFDQADKDRLAQWAVKDEYNIHPGVDVFYRMPLTDANYIADGTNAPSASDIANINLATSAYRVSFTFDNNWRPGVVQVISLTAPGANPNQAAADAWKLANATILAKPVSNPTPEADRAAIDKALTEFAALDPAVQALLTAEKAKLEQMKTNLPPLVISGTAVLDKKVMGVTSYKITLVGAKANQVTAIKGFHSDATAMATPISYDTAALLTNTTDNFLVRNLDTPQAGDYVELTIGSEVIKVVLP
ncbi:MAG: S-layer homology domain-containing protein [Tissierellia bacterium]|nr:S-layer homology domain-containing protein [Tissierellia bacterium]